MRTPAFRKRLQEIVDYVFDGNVKAAAEAADVEQPTLHRILAGKVREPRLSTLERLADRYGVPLDWLLGRVDVLQPERGHGNVKLPRWYVLIALYHERARRDDHLFIQSCDGKTRTEHGTQIVHEYWEMGRLDRTRMVFHVCVQPALDADRAIDSSFLPAWRALLEMETRMAALARDALVRLGEGSHRGFT